MWRANTRPRVSHQLTIANDSPLNSGLTWILYPAMSKSVEIDYEKLSSVLRSRREQLGMSIRDLSHRSGYSERTVSRAERGRAIQVRTLRDILDALELSFSDIASAEEPKVKPKGKNIFVSYSHRNREYLDRLMIHLKPLERQGLIDAWVDTRLRAGDKWKKEIEQGLKKSRVAVLMISADFLASDFIIDNELPPLLQAAEEKGTLIIPVILKPCRFTRDKNLSEFQAINQPDEPVALLDENERELIYDTIALRIEKALEP